MVGLCEDKGRMPCSRSWVALGPSILGICTRLLSPKPRESEGSLDFGRRNYSRSPSRGEALDGGGEAPDLRLFVRSRGLVFVTEIPTSVLHEELVCLALGGDVTHEGVLAGQGSIPLDLLRTERPSRSVACESRLARRSSAPLSFSGAEGPS